MAIRENKAMKKVLLVCVVGVAAVLGACKPEKVEAPSTFADGSTAPPPVVTVSGDGYEVNATYPKPGSPSLTRWWNGRVVVTCPRGYHFDVQTIDPINDDDNGAIATCEANKPPAS